MGVCGVILCGGQSRRMGTDKANLAVNNHSMLERQIQLMQQVELNALLVSGKPEHAMGIADGYPGRGPLAGIHAAMMYTQQDYLLFIPVDMPLLQADDLTLLLKRGNSKPVHFQHHALPLLLPNRAEIADWIDCQLASASPGDCCIRRLCEQFNASSMAHRLPNRLRNANTPQQWQQCLALM